MRRVLLAGWVCVMATDAPAHRLDEYLQAMRIAVTTNRFDLSLELTPGVTVADQLLTVIDTNRDGQISANEGKAYAQQVLNDTQARVDDEVVALSLADNFFSSVAEMKAGVGFIRIQAAASAAPLVAGKHTLTVTNSHLPAISVYQVNAVVPKNPAIKITKQTRDELQAGYELQFEVARGPVNEIVRPRE